MKAKQHDTMSWFKPHSSWLILLLPKGLKQQSNWLLDKVSSIYNTLGKRQSCFPQLTAQLTLGQVGSQSFPTAFHLSQVNEK